MNDKHSLDQIRRAVEDAAHDRYDGKGKKKKGDDLYLSRAYAEEVYPDHAIIRKPGDKLCRVNFTLSDASGKLTAKFSDEVAVRKVYEPVGKSDDDGDENVMGSLTRPEGGICPS